MNDALSSLKMIDSSLIVLHENCEPARLEKTQNSIRSEGVLRHPPAAIKMKNGKYLVIDGAHRTSSLQALGYSQIPLHIVGIENVVIDNWDHSISDINVIEYLKSQKNLVRIERFPLPERLLAKMRNDSVSYYVYPYAQQNHFDIWHELISFYQNNYTVTRIETDKEMELKPNMLRISYSTCTLREIEEVVSQNKVLPAGVTRFKINGRILNLQIPLSMLGNSLKDATEWENMLNNRRDSMRYYPESVYICEN
ncbi:ParB N-terminal domain-containing protein [Paenibacillus wenxiniae]|uniref:ParB N-terminal domain-containing protein n=1 Tax=Paenibacillus wenxiniae TaxID=1636843 RepID=A0ABW4RN24_9BACL